MKSLKIDCIGYEVDADWYEGEHTDDIVLALIGWPSNRANYQDLLTAIVGQTGMSALVFEFSGLGDSKVDINRTRPAQHFLEVIYVFDWLRAKHPHAKITVMGTSYGGYLATQLTKYRTFGRLILRVPAIYPPEDFYSLNSQINSDEIWAAHLPYRKDKAALAKHPLLARASQTFKGKTLVVPHELDQEVPIETTDAYIDAFQADVYLAKGIPHSFRDSTSAQKAAYQKAISDWLNATR